MIATLGEEVIPAPRHVANIRALVRSGYFDGLAVMRVQDNFVAQWGDAEGQRPVTGGVTTLPPEITVPLTPGLPFTRLPDPDGFAPEVGFSAGMPAARDPKSGRAWLAHCYGMIGAGRGNEPESGSGAELYVVIGHAPRQLDRNIALVGRVVQGMELLSVLPRGTGPLGFYEQPSQHVPIDNSRSFTFGVRIPARETRTFTFTLRADKSGLFRGDVDICEGTRFISAMAQTSVKEKD